MNTLYFDNNIKALCAIDQTKLPGKLEYIKITDVYGLCDALKTLKIQGANSCGIGTALGLYACALRAEDVDTVGFCYSFASMPIFYARHDPPCAILPMRQTEWKTR